MKIRCARAPVHDGVQAVGAVATQRSIKESLQFIRLQAEEGRIVLEATDFDVSVRYQVSGVSVEDPGVVIIPASRMVALFRDVPGDELTMSSEATGLRVGLGGGRFRIPIRSEGDFPELPGVQEGVRFRIGRDVLTDLVRKASVATGEDRTRYAFDAVQWIVGNGAFRIASTDGKRMSYVAAPVETAGAEMKQVLVQARGLPHILRAFAPGEEEAEVALDDFQVGLRTGVAEVYVRLAEGRFPEFQGLLQKRLDSEAVLKRGEFERAVRAASVFAGSDAPAVILSFQPGQVVFRSGSSDAGDAEIAAPAEYSGAEVELGFNPYYLLEFLKVVDEDAFRIEFEDTNTSARFRVGENFTHIVMPISTEYAGAREE